VPPEPDLAHAPGPDATGQDVGANALYGIYNFEQSDAG
jgi:hypothetical protein